MTAAFTVAKTQRALEQESKSMSPGNVTLPIPTKRERERETQRHKIKVHSTISTQRLLVHTASVYVFSCVCVFSYTVLCTIFIDLI